MSTKILNVSLHPTPTHLGHCLPPKGHKALWTSISSVPPVA